MLRLQRSHLPIVESTCPKVACVYNERGTCDEPRISKGNSDLDVIWVMSGKMAEWHPKRGPITKIMIPDGVKGDIAPLALGLWYNFHEVGCHLGNFG